MAVASTFMTYNEKPIIPSSSRGVVLSLKVENLSLSDVKRILDKGYECGEEIAENSITRCLQIRNRTVKIVIVDMGEYWILQSAKSFKTVVKKRRRYIRKARPKRL